MGILWFFLGTFVGSFLNVLILRGSWKLAGDGRSRCPGCHKNLSWFELIPIISFLFQRGRCRGCNKKISYIYPFVEVLTGVTFLLAFIYSISILNIVIACLLIVLSVIDFRDKEVPDEFLIQLALLGFLSAVFSVDPSTSLIAGLVAVPFFFLWWVSKERWMGEADGIIALACGWTLASIPAAISFFMLTFWIGAIVSIPIYLYSLFKKKIIREVPLIPFMALSWLAILLFGPFPFFLLV